MFAKILGSSFPIPPDMHVPLDGRVELIQNPFTKYPPIPYNDSQFKGSSDSLRTSESPSKELVDITVRCVSKSVRGRFERKLPIWVRKSKYTLTRVAYDSNSGAVVENDFNQPPTPAISPQGNLLLKRPSTRSTSSAPRKPKPLPLPFDSYVSSEKVLEISPKPIRSTSETLEGSLRVSCVDFNFYSALFVKSYFLY